MAPIPVPDQDIICLGINYLAHAEESARFKKEAFSKPDQAVYFSKRVNRATDPGDGIPSHKELTSQLDYEAELAVILKKDAKDVALEDVEDYIFGYTIMNDVSAREVQTAHRQWYFGKSLDGFTPLGPPTAWNFRQSSGSSPVSTESCARIPTRNSSFTGSQKWSVS